MLKLFDPLAMISLLGPFFLWTAFRIIRGQITTDGSGAVAALLNEAGVPGLLDFTIQYYTALMVSVFWAFAWGAGIFGFAVQKIGNGKLDCFKNGEPSNGQISVYFGGFFLFFFVVWALILGGVATPHLLGRYMDNATTLGQVQWPVWSSPLFLLRCSIGVHLVLMSFFHVSPFNKQDA